MEPKYLISNESGYLQIIPYLQTAGNQGGAYIGVGSEQNFTYIAKTRPRIAFVVDNRRENLLAHLLFRAIFEHARTRQEYLSLLFSKPLDRARRDAGLPELVDYFAGREGDDLRVQRNLARLIPRLNTYLHRLSQDDLKTIEWIYETFHTHHLTLRWTPDRPTMFGYPVPTYREILLARTPDGRLGHFLADDDDFAFVKMLQTRQRILPIMGDVAGPKTLREIGAFLKKRKETVSTFYLSNVEYFLFQTDRFASFVQNVRTLPVHERSVFIRAFVNTETETHPAGDGHTLLTSTVQRIRTFLRLYDEGRYQTYRDVGVLDYIGAGETGG